jgi:hypothetical protein
MLLRIAAFELRQQLRSHVFWIVFAISLLMVVGALSNEQLRVGIGAERGGALVIRTHLIWSLFYMFTAAAFVADAVLRDDATGLCSHHPLRAGAATRLPARPLPRRLRRDFDLLPERPGRAVAQPLPALDGPGSRRRRKRGGLCDGPVGARSAQPADQRGFLLRPGDRDAFNERHADRGGRRC